MNIPTIDTRAYLYLKGSFDLVDPEASFYDAPRVFFLWDPDSDTWAQHIRKFSDPKKSSFCFGEGYGVLEVVQTHIVKKTTLDPESAAFLFGSYLRVHITYAAINCRKSGLLRVSGSYPRVYRLGKKQVCCEVRLGMCIIPMPFKDAVKSGVMGTAGHVPEWIIETRQGLKRYQRMYNLYEHYFSGVK